MTSGLSIRWRRSEWNSRSRWPARSACWMRPACRSPRLSPPLSPSWSSCMTRGTSPPCGWGAPDPAFGLGTPDDPVFAGMHDASALVAGATLAAARAAWTSQADHAVSIAGGLHHAMRRMASGFCVYNDPAIAISWLLRQGAQRVAYVDIDVHHGDGV